MAGGADLAAGPEGQEHRPRFVSSSLKVVHQWGSDEGIVEAARMSTMKGFKGWEKDLTFLAYLWDHQHTSPFEQAGFAVEVECPIFVARQWMRHRTQSYNEKSLRYVEHDDSFFDVLGWRVQDSVNKQSSLPGRLPEDKKMADLIYFNAVESCAQAYKKLLSLGIGREQARVVLPLSTMTTFRAQATLFNWIRFASLRSAPGAQEEIRELSDEVKKTIKYYFPRTYGVVYGQEGKLVCN